MKDRIFKEKKLRVREWRMFEVLPLDVDDMDYDREIEVKDVKPKKRRVRKKLHGKKRVRVEVKSEEKSSVRDLINDENLGPELDTVRIYFDCENFVRIDDFIQATSVRNIKSVYRNPLGEVMGERDFYRNEMRYSSWGKMVVSKEQRKYGKNAKYSHPVLCFEYSVAKWWFYASAVNSGEEPSAMLLLLPCLQAMKVLHIEDYSSVSLKRIGEEFVTRAELRRMDLSLNFKVPLTYTATDYVNLISRCMINRQEASRHADGSISFATDKSPYRVIVYDKELEAKNYYNDTKNCLKFAYFVDKYGIVHPTNDEPGLKEEYFDEAQDKKLFYEKNKDKFKNNLRFEVQFRTKFFQEHNLMTTGEKNIDNVIRLGKFYWVELLSQIDEQLNRRNFEYKESQKEPVAEVLTKIQEDRDNGLWSRTKANNMIGFLQDCYSRTWQEVYKQLGRSLFYNYRKWLLTNYDYDVKVALSDDLPIMRVIETLVCSRQGRMIRDYKLVPAPVETLAI